MNSPTEPLDHGLGVITMSVIGKMIQKTPSTLYQYCSNCMVMLNHLMVYLMRVSLESSRKDGES